MKDPKNMIRPGAGYIARLVRPGEFALPRKRKLRKRRPFSAPERSARLYVYIAPDKVHMFRFFLETEENLGIMTVVDRWRAALLVRFSPHQEKEMRVFLDSLVEPLGLQVVEAPTAPRAASQR